MTVAQQAQQWLVEHLPAPAVYRLAEWRHGRQEPELRLVPELVPAGRVAVDVGAWLGPWTRALARRASTVHAFEPQPRLAHFLRRVVGPNVVVHEAAVGASTGEATLAVDGTPGSEALARLTSASRPPAAHERQTRVPVVALDDLALDDVGFVKIDVEGHELEALAGAERTLVRDRPVLVVEVEQRHAGADVHGVFGWLEQRGWVGSFLRDGRWRPLAEFDVARDQTQWLHHLADRRYVNNFLFRPAP